MGVVQMTRRHGWIALLVVGGVGLVGLTTHVVLRASQSSTESITLVKPLACSSCGHVYDGPISRPPIDCPKCGQQAVWPAMKCSKCGATVPCDRRKFRQEGRDPHCFKCGSTQLTSLQDSS